MLFTAYFLLEFQIVSIYLCQLHIMGLKCRYTEWLLKGRICTRKCFRILPLTVFISALIVFLPMSYVTNWLGSREKHRN